MKTNISDALYQQALTLMPGGVNSPVRACRNVGKTPLFIERAYGDKLVDADGNEYIDYVCSWGPNIFGHCRKEITESVIRAVQNGLTFGACHKGEIELAELIKKNVPSIELIRLVNSGTEAVMSAIRAARGYTGRDKIIKFEGCYHGHSDGLLAKAGSGVLTNSLPDSEGVPKGCTDNTLSATYNDENSVKELFERMGEEIACVVIEPCAANMGVVPPKEGFLKFLRQITSEYGALLLFDEVITGFRLSAGGAQQYYGVKPDLTALGKIIGGGMPLAAYGGKREIMECIAPLGNVYQAGTLSGNPVAVAAGIAMLRLIEATPDLYSELDRKSALLEKSLFQKGIYVNRVGSVLTPFFTDGTVTDFKTAKSADVKQYAKYYSHLIENGILVAPSQFEAMFVSYAHSDEDIYNTIKIIENFLE
ncbi:glutamate-1-semialdehyde 2,1-aminomutase [Ruminococcus sp.]|uniref:glutamate-1-semialdehyde 2,1-aminomutase n=1 Tax=Ruminococcus sp. TaxID=41978 RepID=UPI002E77E322|nr:glutamate-1-semialdehyde 2,1-aminomutase [Ruminococcus sp.]MEE1264328.1 glutamate-1-semialdehyde 2,1-aminomutase [Ruminococcus sp.]